MPLIDLSRLILGNRDDRPRLFPALAAYPHDVVEYTAPAGGIREPAAVPAPLTRQQQIARRVDALTGPSIDSQLAAEAAAWRARQPQPRVAPAPPRPTTSALIAEGIDPDAARFLGRPDDAASPTIRPPAIVRLVDDPDAMDEFLIEPRKKK